MQQCIEEHEKNGKPRKQAWITPRLKRLVKKQHPSTEIEEPNARTHRTTHPVQKPTRTADQKREKSPHHEQNGAVQKRAKTTSESSARSHAPKKQHQNLPQYNGDTLTHPQQIADALNNHYITIGGKIANITPPTTKPTTSTTTYHHHAPTFPAGQIYRRRSQQAPKKPQPPQSQHYIQDQTCYRARPQQLPYTNSGSVVMAGGRFC